MLFRSLIQRPFLSIPAPAERWLKDEAVAGRSQEVAALYRAVYRPAVLMWSLLSANNRTIVIFISFLVGLPQGYPWFELFALNIILAALVGMNAVVMDNAVVGAESIVGAAAFVKAGMDIPPRSMVVGAPAKILQIGRAHV